MKKESWFDKRFDLSDVLLAFAFGVFVTAIVAIYGVSISRPKVVPFLERQAACEAKGGRYNYLYIEEYGKYVELCSKSVTEEIRDF